MKPYDICIYHANCADGFASAYVCWRWHQENGREQPQYVAASYQDAPPDTDGLHVLIVDFSYQPSDMELMCQGAERVVWLDHHKTAIDSMNAYAAANDLPANFSATYTLEKSGCRLAWEHFYPNEDCLMAIKLIEDRDLWKFVYGDTSKDFHAAIMSYPREFASWDELIGFDQETLLLANEGGAILRAQTKHIQAMIDQHTQPIGLMGFAGVSLNCPPMWASEAGHMLMEQCSLVDFACTWFEQHDGRRQYSLRSNDEHADVGEIAKAMGGGGHRNAAGFVLSAKDLREMRL